MTSLVSRRLLFTRQIQNVQCLLTSVGMSTFVMFSIVFKSLTQTESTQHCLFKVFLHFAIQYVRENKCSIFLTSSDALWSVSVTAKWRELGEFWPAWGRKSCVGTQLSEKRGNQHSLFGSAKPFTMLCCLLGVLVMMSSYLTWLLYV